MGWPDEAALEEMGFSGYGPQDLAKIADVLREALTVRTGARIRSHLDDRAIFELDPFMSGNVPGMKRWLDAHVPGYEKRTDYLLKGLGGEARYIQRYRLPTEAEWEYAARGKEGTEFPWEEVDVKTEDGCFYANFKPDRGNYTEDGNLITSRVGLFSSNSNGLYDMAGNVAEWTSTTYTEGGIDAMNDLNPELKYNAAKEDPYSLKKKSVRGGSWKDPESYIRSAWRTWEYQNQPRCYIGFRCVRSLASTTSTKQKGRKK